VRWGDSVGVEFPFSIKHLGLPPFDLALSLHIQIDHLDQLTRLDCVGTGYYPSNLLTGLRVRPRDAFTHLMLFVLPWQ
jgi:hypothetical protein